MIYYLMGAGAIVCVLAFVVSMSVMRKQQHTEVDSGINETTKQHRLLGNRMILAYILFPVAVVVGAAILMYYYS